MQVDLQKKKNGCAVWLKQDYSEGETERAVWICLQWEMGAGRGGLG